jgi:hypothetical protein
MRISKEEALEKMQNNKGRFFTVEFTTKKDNTVRRMNCQYLSGQKVSKLGLVKVKECSKMKKTPDNCIRNFYIGNLIELKINGEECKIK